MRRLLCLLVVVVSTTACGKAEPWDGEVAYAVVVLVKKSDGYGPLTNTGTGPCGVMKGPITDAKVRVVERGAFNDNQKYWPIKVRITGKCNAERPNCGPTKNELCPPEPADFTINEFAVRLRRDDYGAWFAEKDRR